MSIICDLQISQVVDQQKNCPDKNGEGEDALRKYGLEYSSV